MAALATDAQSAARSAAEAIDGQRTAAADRLDQAAEALYDNAERIPGVASFARSAADGLGSTADYVRENDVDAMLADVTGAIKRNPGVSLLLAAGVGFVLGRTLSRL